MSDIQYPENGKKNVKLKSTDLCGNTRNGVREVNIIQRLLEGQYISILEDGDKATISADVSADYYNKAQINELIGDLGTVKFKIVSALPATGAENVIYLVPKAAPDIGYDQYIWDADASLFYPIGDTDIDLSDYYTKEQSDNRYYTKSEVYQKSETYSQAEADAKFQELLSNGTGITSVTDTTDFSQVSLGDKTVRQATGLSIWNYIKSKMAGAISTVVEDDVTGNRVLVSTPLGKVTTSSITSEELFTLDDIRSNVQQQIDDKLDKIVMGEETSTMVDTTPITYLDVPNNETHVVRGSTIWTYIKSKLNVDNLTSISDTTKIGSVDKSKTNVVQQFTASVLFQYMWKKIYPVGAIYISYSSTSPATLFGGTWTQITGRFLVASGSASYSYVNTSGSSTTGTVTFNATNTGGSPRVQLTTDTMPKHQHGLPYRKCGSYSGTDWRTDPGSVDGYAGNTQPAGGGSYPTGYGAPFNQLPPYLVVYMWRRTA